MNPAGTGAYGPRLRPPQLYSRQDELAPWIRSGRRLACPDLLRGERPTLLDSLLRRHDPAAVVEVLVWVGPSALDPFALSAPTSWAPHTPFALSAPTLRRGVSKGPHNSVLGWGRCHHWRQGCALPSIRAGEAPAPLRVSGLRGPLKSEHLPLESNRGDGVTVQTCREQRRSPLSRRHYDFRRIRGPAGALPPCHSIHPSCCFPCMPDYCVCCVNIISYEHLSGESLES